MAPKKRPTRARSKTSARGRKPGRAHHELIGLGLLAVGLFLAVVTWLEGNGGIVGTKIADWLDALFGTARIGVPIVLLVLGGLLIARASLVDVKPFRTGLVVTALGLMLVLGSRGGYVGRALEEVVGTLVGRTGLLIAGVTALTAGVLRRLHKFGPCGRRGTNSRDVEDRRSH